jgi:hypothetical protein
VQTQQQTISLLVAEKASLAASLERLEGVDQREWSELGFNGIPKTWNDRGLQSKGSRETEELLAQKEQDIEGLNSRIAMLEDDVRSSSDMVSELLTTQREEVEKRRALVSRLTFIWCNRCSNQRSHFRNASWSSQNMQQTR